MQRNFKKDPIQCYSFEINNIHVFPILIISRLKYLYILKKKNKKFPHHKTIYTLNTISSYLDIIPPISNNYSNLFTSIITLHSPSSNIDLLINRDYFFLEEKKIKKTRDSSIYVKNRAQRSLEI